MVEVDWDKCPVGSRVEAKLEAIHGDVTEIKSYNGRLRKVEKFVWAVGGGVSLLSLILVCLGILIKMKVLIP